MTELGSEYRKRFDSTLVPLAQRIETHLRNVVLQDQKRIDRISARAKSVDRFVAKAQKIDGHGSLKYNNPFKQIQDQVGARVIVFYVSDVDIIAERITQYFTPAEQQLIIPESESEFGYVGRHFILLTPKDVLYEGINQSDAPKFFELQIKTLFQHAWSEANHDLGYKPSTQLTSDQKRRIAFTAAQAWGADQIFEELHQSLAAA